MSHDIERLWEKLRSLFAPASAWLTIGQGGTGGAAGVAKGSGVRSRLDEAAAGQQAAHTTRANRWQQALEARCNDVLTEASSLLTSAQGENAALALKVDELSNKLEASEAARSNAESTLSQMNADHAELKSQQETLKMSVSTLVQQVPGLFLG